MALSPVSASETTFLTSQRTLLVVLEPLKQMRVDLKSAKTFLL